ncbi:MAG: GNAT family N-acetyltransferase [Christensenellales bacterium]
MTTEIIYTDRLILRPILQSDVDDIFSCWMSDEDVSRYMYWQASNNIQDAVRFVQEELSKIDSDDWYRWLITTKDATTIGTCLIYFDDEQGEWDISYNLGKEYWGQGYATEAMHAVLRFAQSVLTIDSCMALHAIENVASESVINKLGFVYEKQVPYECNGGSIHTKGKLYRLRFNRPNENCDTDIHHQGTKVLTTDRLILRPLTLQDAPSVFDNWASDDEVTKYLTWPTHRSVEDSTAYLTMCGSEYNKPDNYQWGIVLKDSGELVGNISVVGINSAWQEAELGWVLGRAWWGLEIMPEAAGKVIEFLFEQVGFKRIFAKYDTANAKSGRVMQKLGMKHECTICKGGKNNQGIVDIACYYINKDKS